MKRKGVVPLFFFQLLPCLFNPRANCSKLGRETQLNWNQSVSTHFEKIRPFSMGCWGDVELLKLCTFPLRFLSSPLFFPRLCYPILHYANQNYALCECTFTMILVLIILIFQVSIIMKEKGGDEWGYKRIHRQTEGKNYSF